MVRLGVIGAGIWGKNLIRVFSQFTQVELCYIADLNPELRQLNQSLYQKTRVVEDYSHLLQDPKLDAVVVATPTETHFSIIREVLKVGKHCFSEKPLTLCPQESHELVQQAEKNHLILMVGHLLKYHPAISYIKKALEKNELGEIFYLYSNRLNLGQVRPHENCWWSLAPHDISLMLYFLETLPIAISATGSCFLQKSIEDVVFATLYYPDHKLAHIHVSWLDPHKVRTLTLVGNKKMLTFNDIDPAEKIRIYDKGANFNEEFTPFAWFAGIRSGDVYCPHIPQIEPLQAECLHFIQCILERIPCRTDAKEGARVVEILAKGQESIRKNGEPVALNFDLDLDLKPRE